MFRCLRNCEEGRFRLSGRELISGRNGWTKIDHLKSSTLWRTERYDPSVHYAKDGKRRETVHGTLETRLYNLQSDVTSTVRLLEYTLLCVFSSTDSSGSTWSEIERLRRVVLDSLYSHFVGSLLRPGSEVHGIDHGSPRLFDGGWFGKGLTSDPCFIYNKIRWFKTKQYIISLSFGLGEKNYGDNQPIRQWTSVFVGIHFMNHHLF